jgi:aminopeptidase N
MKRTRSSIVAAGLGLLLVGSTVIVGYANAAEVPGGAAVGSPGADGLGDPLFPQDGNGGYHVSHYDVKLDYDPAKPDFLSGDTTVEAVASQDLNRFNLDLVGFSVTSVEVNGAPAAKFAREGGHELVITPAEVLRTGATFTTRVVYSGKPGLFWMQSDEAGSVNVLGEPHSATSWYPVNDHPSDKATFHLAVTLPDNGMEVVGNGEPEAPTVHDGRKTFGWNEKAPIAPYLSGLTIRRMTVVRSALADGTLVVDAFAPDAETAMPAANRLGEVVGFLSSKFGKYPFSSSGGIYFPGEGGGGFETQDRPMYPNGASLAEFKAVVHEIAHQWFGNSVSVKTWADICLKECFATYAEWLWNEAKNGHNLDNDYRAQVNEHKADAQFWSMPLAEPGDAFYGGSYTVGPLMLHALRRNVGDTAFFTTLQTWNEQHKHGNASFAEFETLAAQQSKQDLTGFFKAWAHSSVIPPDEYLFPKSLPAA